MGSGVVVIGVLVVENVRDQLLWLSMDHDDEENGCEDNNTLIHYVLDKRASRSTYV